MNRRLPVVLLAALAAFGALAYLLAWATHGGEPLSDAGAPPSRGADFATEQGGAASPDAPRLPAATAAEPATLPAGAGRVRVVVNETATRLSPVAVRLQRDGDEHPTPMLVVDAEHAWADLAPGRWQVLLAGTGWAATPDRFELAPGGEALVEVRPRNRIEGLLVATRSGRPVVRATLSVDAWKPMTEDSDQWIFVELGSAQNEARDGRFALAGADLPIGGTDIEHLRVRADAEGLLEGVSDPLPLLPTPFWSGVVVALPDPVLTGHVLGVDPVDGRVPVPGARVLLVDPSVTLSEAAFAGGLTLLLDAARQPLEVTDADAEGAFAFGPLPAAATVLTARLLVRGEGWAPALSPPMEIDQRAPARSVDVLLARGGRVHGLIRVPLAPGAGTERAPVATPDDVNLNPDGEAPAGAARHFVAAARRLPAPADEPDTALFEFEFTGLPAGRWLVLASLQPAEAAPDSHVGVQTLVAPVEVRDGQRTDVALALQAEPHGATVTGTVQLPEGLLLDHAEVAVFPAPAEGRLPPPAATAPLGADGSFSLSGVPPGDWTLAVFGSSARLRDVVLGAGFVRVGAVSPPPLHLDLSRPEVSVQAGPATRGRRLRLAGRCGDPVLDVLIALGRVSVVPDAEGAARLFGLLPAHWTLRADGEPPAEVEFELPAGASVVNAELP